MRADCARAERRREVRIAAHGWRRVGAIDDATLKAIEVVYPDDRARLGPAFRTVAFVFGLLALLACFGVLGLMAHGSRGFGVACLVFSFLLVAATEVLLGPFRRADSGIESATALMSFVFALVAIGTLFHDTFGSERGFVALLLLVAVLIAAIGSARWGAPLLAVLAGACGFLFLARLPDGRLLWLLGACLVAPFFLRASESRALAPSHRRSFQLCLVLALVAFYLAVHLGSWDQGWLEWLADFREDRLAWPASLRGLSIFATALVPVAVLGFGIVTRRGFLVDLGIVLGVASLVTLRFYVHVAPLWVVLIAAGGAALLTTLGVRRLLATGASRERGGFTAEPLFEDEARQKTIGVAVAATAFSPEAAPRPPEIGSRFAGGGGDSGGGGAGESF